MSCPLPVAARASLASLQQSIAPRLSDLRRAAKTTTRQQLEPYNAITTERGSPGESVALLRGSAGRFDHDMESTSSRSAGAGPSPYDTPASAGTRFGVELVAWVAGPWATADVIGSWWVALPALVVLVGLPSVFNTPGDKNTTGVATPGPIRIAIEMFLLAVAVGSAWIVWPLWAAVVVTLLGAVMLVTGLPRYRWLAAGAPPMPT